MKNILLIFVCFMLANALFAQQKSSSSPWKFNSLVNAGMLNGGTGSAFQVQTMNGVSKGSWFGGLGLGIDYYKIRSIPLFFDIRKEFGKTRNKLFVYGDAGINFAWATNKGKDPNDQNDHFTSGFYSDLGLGYSVHIHGSSHLNISLGYSYKKITEKTDNLYFLIPMYWSANYISTALPNPTQTNYDLNRLSIKLGWKFR